MRAGETKGAERAITGDRKKPGELCGSRLPLGLRIESRIPLVELASEIFIQSLCPYLQEQMGAAATPAHLLFFIENLLIAEDLRRKVSNASVFDQDLRCPCGDAV